MIVEKTPAGAPGKVETLAKGPETPPPVAQGNPAGSPQPAAPPVTAKSSVPLFGGNRGGRKRKDGLKPGSPAAAAADLEKERLRKQNERLEKRQLLPPTLPPATGPAPAPQNIPVAFVDQPQPGADGVLPGANAAPAPFVPWLGKKIEPVSERLVAIMEELRGRRISKRARLANLPPETVEEIEHTIGWDNNLKRLLSESSAEVAAKYLNKAGVSAEYQPEITLAGALLAAIHSDNQVMKRLDKLIAAANPKPAEKKT
jgi:hypothetical protein